MVASSKSHPFSDRAGLGQGFPLSPVLFIIFMDRISWRTESVRRIKFGSLWIPFMLFADGVVLLASLNSNLQFALKISSSKSEVIVLSRKRIDHTHQVGKELLPLLEEFKYLRSCSQLRRKCNG